MEGKQELCRPLGQNQDWIPAQDSSPLEQHRGWVPSCQKQEKFLGLLLGLSASGFNQGDQEWMAV